jgi:hypothetical protein
VRYFVIANDQVLDTLLKVDFAKAVERALELLELVCKADATFEGKAGEFDRHLALVLNKLEG